MVDEDYPDDQDLPPDPSFSIVIRWDALDGSLQVDIRGVSIIEAASILRKAEESVYDMIEEPEILTDDPAVCFLLDGFDEED